MPPSLRLLVLLLALASPACDDEDVSFVALRCTDTSCDPACQSLLDHPPSAAKSSCSPPGPICDFARAGTTWEYACGADLHIHCNGPGCPVPDLGASD